MLYCQLKLYGFLLGDAKLSKKTDPWLHGLFHDMLEMGQGVVDLSLATLNKPLRKIEILCGLYLYE